MLWARNILAILLFVLPGSLQAQEADAPTLDLFSPTMVAPKLDFGAGTATQGLAAPVPYAPTLQPPLPPPAPEPQHELRLAAQLVTDGEPLVDGVTWRIFGPEPGPDGRLPLVASAEGGAATVRLAAGDYLVHAAFGRAGATKRVTVAGRDQAETMVLDAGGLRLDAIVGDDEPVAAEHLSFEILQENEEGELATVIPAATPSRILRLSAGTYHVISRYGEVNAIVRADIEVEPGKLTEATMRHTGAEVTLKLVSTEGGEAVANTSWTVLTQDGTTVHESIGAFPSIVLAEGAYSAVASHHDQIYSRDFTVEAGVDRDIEVRLADIVQPETAAPADGVAATPDAAAPEAAPLEP